MRIALFSMMIFWQTTVALAQNGGGISANELVGTKWYIDGFLGLDTARVHYTLSPYKEGMFRWGTFIAFSSSEKTFSSRNSERCGNDCFITVNGTYDVDQGRLLRIALKEVDYSEYCTDASAVKHKGVSLDFEMTFRSDTLLLKKVN